MEVSEHLSFLEAPHFPMNLDPMNSKKDKGTQNAISSALAKILFMKSMYRLRFDSFQGSEYARCTIIYGQLLFDQRRAQRVTKNKWLF